MRAGEVLLVAGCELFVSTSGLDSASQQEVACEMPLSSFVAMTAIVHLVPFVFDRLPLATKRYFGREKCLYVQFKGMCYRRM